VHLIFLLFFACGADGWVHRAREVAGTSRMNTCIIVGMLLNCYWHSPRWILASKAIFFRDEQSAF
jgi:hypothetical protein